MQRRELKTIYKEKLREMGMVCLAFRRDDWGFYLKGSGKEEDQIFSHFKAQDMKEWI